jgi:hypothetical protein
MDTLKAEQLNGSKWRVLAIPFGGPFKGGKDLDGEFFSPRTDIKAEWFGQRPVLWHHGQDPVMKDTVIGVEDDLVKADDGWWATIWLNRGTRYLADIEAMLSAGKAFGSSGAISHLVRKDRKSGEILTWPHAEQTLSTVPINIFSRVVPAKALLGFDDAGISLDDRVKAILADLDAIAAEDLRPDLLETGELKGDLETGGDDAAMTERQAIALGRLLLLRERAASI